MSSSLFVKYGAKAGAGPAFLKRTRSAVAQEQARTRTGTTSNQLQTRTRSGSQSCSSTLQYTYPCCCGGERNWGVASDCPVDYWNARLGQCPGSSDNSMPNSYQYCWDISSTGFYCIRRSCWVTGVYSTSCGSCTWGSYTAWTNTTSCSVSSPGCSNGAVQRQCQTITVCNWGEYGEWSDVSSCTPSSPECSNGAVETQCQTVYNWGEWSAYEEADICTPQTSALGAGAVEIECVPQ